MLQIKKLDIFPQFRKFIDMWKKHPGFTVYIPLQIERYDFWWYFMNIYLMSTCIQQWNYSILCINLYSCARIFCEVRESLVFVNACISHRDLVFKCLSLVFSLWIGWFLSIIEVKIIEKPSTLYFPTFHQSHFACFSFTWPSQIGRIFIPVVFKQTFLSRTF